MSAKKLQETILCYFAGALFAVAWWLFIDATVYHANESHPVKVEAWHYIGGIISTIGLIGINIVSWNDLNADLMWGENVSARARVFLFVSFFVCFAGLIFGVWVAVEHWFINEEATSSYGGVALLVQNLLIFASALIYRFARPQEEDII